MQGNCLEAYRIPGEQEKQGNNALKAAQAGLQQHLPICCKGKA